MNFKRLLAIALGCAMAIGASADGPFRQHRYDSFHATPTEPGQIIFAGNSITNMHSWFEAFGSHQEVIGRGNSGGLAYEVLDNMEYYIDSKPAKLFLMIGTNDISSGLSAEITAKRIETIVRRVRLESPETEVYVESILPRSNNPKPAYEACNTIVRNWVESLNDPKVHAINLSTVCAGLNGNGTWTYDGLHPRPIGYSAWTHHIESQVGYNSVYPLPADITNQDPCGVGNNSNGARVSQFRYFPIAEGDVLFFGDEQVHGGEWHELLRSDKIKDRATCYGWGGISLDAAKQVVTASLENQAVKPAKIFLFYGIGDKDETRYREVVDEAKAQAPQAQIYLVSLSPSTAAATNTANVNFNTVMQTVAEEKGCTYVDVYTPLNAQINQNIMGTNYISGRGYIVMANALAPYLTEEGVNPVTLEEYDATYARRSVRKIIGDALTQAFMRGYHLSGNITASCADGLPALIDEAVAAVNNPNLTTEAATDIATRINTYLDENVEQLTSGWYVIQAAQADNTDYMINADACVENNGIFHNGSGCCPLVFSPTAVSGPQGWVYIDVVNGNYQLAGINGWYIGSKGVGSRTAYNSTFNEGVEEGTVVLPEWTKFTSLTASRPGSLPIVGSSASLNLTATLTRVPDAEVEAYDVWTVNIVDSYGGTSSESLYLDTRVTLNSPENHGITTVYNHGKFFLTPGTVPTEDMITLSRNDATTSLEYPVVKINADNKTITVSETHVAEITQSGWYVIQSAAADNSDFVVNSDAYAENDGLFHNKFGLCPLVFSPSKIKGDNAPQGWVYIDVNNGNYQLSTITGWYIADNATGSRTAYNYPITAGTAEETFIIPHTTKFASMKATHAGSLPIFGGSGSANNPYYLSLVPADKVAEYDVWTVSITDTDAGTKDNTDSYYHLDTRVTLNSDANHGVTTVYNRGKFFLTPGTVLTPDMFTVGTNASTTRFTDPVVKIDATAKTITVVEVSEEPEPEPVATTWELVTTPYQLEAGKNYKIIAHCNNTNYGGDRILTHVDNTSQWPLLTEETEAAEGTVWTFEEATRNCNVAAHASYKSFYLQNSDRYFTKGNGNASVGTSINTVAPATEYGCIVEFVPFTNKVASEGLYTWGLHVRTANNAIVCMVIKNDGNNNHSTNNNGFSESYTKDYTSHYLLYKEVTEEELPLFNSQAATNLAKTQLASTAGKNFGDNLHEYSFTNGTTIDQWNAYGAELDAIFAATPVDVEAATAKLAEIEEAYNSISINQPATGSFIRIYNPDGDFTYALGSDKDASNRVMGSGEQDATSVFYFDGSHLVNYTNGYYIKQVVVKQNPKIAYPASAAQNVEPSNIKFVPSWYTPLPNVYSVSFADDDARCVHLSAATGVTESGKFPSPKSEAAFKPYAFRLEQLQTLPVTINAYGATTITAPVDLQVPDGVTAYAATSADNVMTLAEVDVIPAGTPAIIVGEAGFYEFPYAPAAATTAEGDDDGSGVTTGAYGQQLAATRTAHDGNVLLALTGYDNGVAKFTAVTGTDMPPFCLIVEADQAVLDENNELNVTLANGSTTDLIYVPATYYSLTIDANAGHFTYTLEPEPEEQGYRAGTVITVKFTKANELAVAKDLSHNDEAVELTTVANAPHQYEYTINGIDRHTNLVLSSDIGTSINEIEGERCDAVIYDLQGRRILTPARGAIYIINGRKLKL